MSVINEYGIIAHGVVCPICITEFDKEEIVVSHDLTHLFHKACLEQWTVNKAAPQCPCCRAILPPGQINNQNALQHPDFLARQEIAAMLIQLAAENRAVMNAVRACKWSLIGGGVGCVGAILAVPIGVIATVGCGPLGIGLAVSATIASTIGASLVMNNAHRVTRANCFQLLCPLSSFAVAGTAFGALAGMPLFPSAALGFATPFVIATASLVGSCVGAVFAELNSN